jgi:DNA-directed RNA polymerase III subunit RPC11
MLLLAPCDADRMHFICQTCPYSFKLLAPVAAEALLHAKSVDDIMGGAEAWKNADQTNITCPDCGHHRAYFHMLQIRSADEPMTTFYKCEKCGNRWKED